jgi:ATP-dependent helicase/nuclease subunit B
MIDRVDRLYDRLRVIDYKFKFGREPKTDEKDLVLTALRGQRLQPPIYLLLAQQWADQQGISPKAEIEADFYYIAPRWPDGPLNLRSYERSALSGKAAAAIQATIALLAEGVRGGRFFINKGDHCSYCEVQAICRKNHPPSIWRAENDPITEPHRELKTKTRKQL